VNSGDKICESLWGLRLRNCKRRISFSLEMWILGTIDGIRHKRLVYRIEILVTNVDKDVDK
jgi:hypothetical protein